MASPFKHPTECPSGSGIWTVPASEEIYAATPTE
eukprot:CAMPEP_0172525322 /NCGR_PEP_ID=MMETSP1067-20121228/351_1 /TAXON_ID=265564 ORGANISM="Thalassiosira punctigera, Strain Tpunct2005C2" /NCGR_SAMPLE_ID=MMETSP1067 /ASSEMBLY_ACC=CAM_ASM_000444 /LENGTH=33 /DNA_ID= /DNA_START= /DNA_END= /DNA_ORIENTATION=